MKKILDYIDEDTMKLIAAIAAIAYTAINLMLAVDTGAFYSHYFAGVMSAIALVIIFEDEEDD